MSAYGYRAGLLVRTLMDTTRYYIAVPGFRLSNRTCRDYETLFQSEIAGYPHLLQAFRR
jgi:hypothetical protein